MKFSNRFAKKEAVRFALSRRHSRESGDLTGTTPPRPWLSCSDCDCPMFEAQQYNVEETEDGPEGWVWFDGLHAFCEECGAENSVHADGDEAYTCLHYDNDGQIVRRDD